MQIEQDERKLAPARAVDKREPLAKVLGCLRGESQQHPVITDNGRPYAIVNTRQLIARGIHDRTGLHKAAQPVSTLEADAPPYRAIEAFADSLAPYLPVVDAKGKLLGVLTAAEALSELTGGPAARDACGPPMSVKESDDVDAAMHAFAKVWDDQLAVLDDLGRVVGVLTRSEMMRLHDFQEQPRGRKDFGGDRLDLRENKVCDWMEAGWESIPQEASFNQVMDAVQEYGYTFVHDVAGHYVGTITAPGLIRSAVQAVH